jgi:chemotaxis protein CheC
MFDIDQMNENELDFFRELENIGASHAASALSMLLSRAVAIRVPHAKLCEYNEICDILHGPENVVAGLLVGISEDIRGFILLVLDEQDAQTLSRIVVGDIAGDDMPESEREALGVSALKEVANMLIGAYITVISELTGFKIEASVPDLVFDMAGAVMNLLAVAYGEFGDHVLFMETEFCDHTQSLFGHFFLIPDVESYKKLTEKMVCY